MTKKLTFKKWLLIPVLFLIFSLASNDIFATDGYFSNGQGTKNKGFAGAGIAYLHSPFMAALNPAGIGFIGKKFSFEVAVGLFNPNRKYTIIGEPTQPQYWPYDGRQMMFGLKPGTVESGSSIFIIPTLAATLQLGEKNSLGFNLYGNGGMNTDYETKTYYSDIIASFGNPMPNGFPNPMANVTVPAGVNITQMFISLTYARVIGEKHSIGISPVFVYQAFEAKGLQAFRDMGSAGMPGMPVDRSAYVTNNGSESSTGFGFKIGYQGELFSGFRLGGYYQPRIKMSKFDKYKGLFAEEGDFDIPANWSAGISYDFTEKLTVLFDVKQIFYSKVNSIGNPMIASQMMPMIPNPDMTSPENAYIPNPDFVPLGSDNGAGFGWKDMMIFKVGAEFRQVENWQFRLGYSYGKTPVQESEVMFNILAPAVNENHISLGITRMLGENELNLAATYALSNTVTGTNPFDPAQQIELSMNQFEIELGFKF
jgi:long-chain fatty acid transport protein